MDGLPAAAAGAVTVIAVDMPTGVNSDTGAVSNGDDDEDGPLFADMTVTFGALKRGLVLYPGRACAGHVEVDPIGMPGPLLMQLEEDPAYLLQESDIAEIVVPRSPDSHKGSHGTIAVVTGAARGIGLATAKRFLADGFRVAMLDIDGENLARSVATMNEPERTLALIDEFGSGTEPTIGGAIAEAILERLLEKGCYGVITTHYANIKYFASGTEGIANGAMLFDVQQIKPLFRLETGKPGSSFAIEIARKIGLPEQIIRSAGEKAGSDHVNIEKQLREIARDRRYWEQKRDRIRLTDRKVEELERSYAEQLARIRAERTEIIRAARQEAQELVAEANRQIENTIRTIREAQAERDLTRMARQELDDFRQAVEQADDRADERAERVAREMERVERRLQRCGRSCRPA